MGVSTYLLDTHVFLWLLSTPTRVPEPTLDVLADPDNTVLVSAASAMEIATKTRLGRLDGQPIVTGWEQTLTSIGAEELPISGSHAVLAGTLAWDHRDPFDRLLVAQAIRERAALVTADQVVVRYPQVACVPV